MRLNQRLAEEGKAAVQRTVVRVLIIVLLLAMVLIQIGGFVYTREQQEDYAAVRTSARGIRIVQQALADAEDGVLGYTLTGEDSHLRRYYYAIEALKTQRPTALRELDPEIGTAAFRSLPATWQRVIGLVRAEEQLQARLVLTREAVQMQVAARAAMQRYLDTHDRQAALIEDRMQFSSSIVLWMQLAGGTLALVALIVAFRASTTEFRARRRAVVDAVAARDQAETLFQMTDMLQSATDYSDANAVFRTTARRLLPDLACALYIFNNSGDRLERSICWGFPEDHEKAMTLSPRSCWALKRGKEHLNLPESAGLVCDHHKEGSALELPMMAMGEIYGLLIVASYAPDAPARLESVRPIARALAEGMSLALSNISLREKLRNQALRDPLTGLYNRRYMEDMLERFAHIATRNDTPLSVAMIDLDHFKRINDEHGHATGDNVLREVAAVIDGGTRQSDVACRYGGEEIILLLADSTLDDSVAKANALRLKIEELSDRFGFRITASMGVASIPDNTQSVAELVTLADAALYQAKQAGRNRVIPAERRPFRTDALAAE